MDAHGARDAYETGAAAPTPAAPPAVPAPPAAPADPVTPTVPATFPADSVTPATPAIPAPADPAGSAQAAPAPDAASARAPAVGQARAGEPSTDPTSPANPAEAADPAEPVAPRTGVAALSPRYQIGVALALAVVAVAVCVHIGMVFLHVAPSNTLTKTHGKAIDEWIYPEFEQNWKLFAPNPLQQNVAVQVRARIRTADGDFRTTGWFDLSAEDGRAIDGNLLPSHTQQNELRRAWDFYSTTHSGENRTAASRGLLAETYLRRIVVLRLHRAEAAGPDGVLERVQVRCRTTPVRPPEWSEERISLKPVDRVLPWWTVPADESRGGAG